MNTPDLDQPPRRADAAMVVDDDITVRRLVRVALAQWGYSVLEAEDGREAVDVYRRNKDSVRFVVCDVVMPHMGGWETLQELRRMTPELPAVMISGFPATAVEQRKQVQPHTFLSKPFSFSDLQEAIQGATGRMSSSPKP